MYLNLYHWSREMKITYTFYIYSCIIISRSPSICPYYWREANPFPSSKQYFPVILIYYMLYKVFLAFESLNGILKYGVTHQSNSPFNINKLKFGSEMVRISTHVGIEGVECRSRCSVFKLFVQLLLPFILVILCLHACKEKVYNNNDILRPLIG